MLVLPLYLIENMLDEARLPYASRCNQGHIALILQCFDKLTALVLAVTKVAATFVSIGDKGVIDGLHFSDIADFTLRKLRN